MAEEVEPTTTDTKIEEDVEDNDQTATEDYGDERAKSTSRENEADKRSKQISLLKVYLDSLAYKMPEKPFKASAHLELLAKPPPTRYVALYEEYGSVLKPKGRARRIERKAKDLTVITTEQLHEQIKSHEEKLEVKRKAAEQRERIFLDIIKNLEKHCHEQLMKELIGKFSTYMSNTCANYTPPPLLTESAQRLTRGLVCNMLLALDINQRPCNADQCLFETIALVLTDMIFRALQDVLLCPFSGKTSEDDVKHKLKTCEPVEKHDTHKEETPLGQFKCVEEHKPDTFVKKKKKVHKRRKVSNDFYHLFRLYQGDCKVCTN